MDLMINRLSDSPALDESAARRVKVMKSNTQLDTHRINRTEFFKLNYQLTSIFVVVLVAFVIILASSIQTSDGAALNVNPVGKYKSPRDRGKFN